MKKAPKSPANKAFDLFDFSRLGNRSVNIPSEQQFAGARLCSLNVERHFTIAQMLFEKQMYGPARSHLILAAEEGVKTILLANGMVRGQAMIEDFGMFFTHKGRLLLAGMVGIPFFFFDQLRTKIHTQDMTKIKLDRWLKQLERNLISGRSSALNLANWWIKAGTLRNDGFYVDYRNDRWKSPGRVKKSSYLGSLKKSEWLIKTAIGLRDLKPEDFRQFQKTWTKSNNSEISAKGVGKNSAS